MPQTMKAYITSDPDNAWPVYLTRDSTRAMHIYITSDPSATHVYIASNSERATLAYVVNPEALRNTPGRIQHSDSTSTLAVVEALAALLKAHTPAEWGRKKRATCHTTHEPYAELPSVQYRRTGEKQS